MNKVIHGDCLDVMPTLPNQSVNMILCDLPYGTTACKWDTVIPFEPLWKEYKRLIKDNAVIVLMASQPFTSVLVMSNPDMFRYDWVWKKPKGTGHLNAKKQPLKDKEDICVFCKGKIPYYPQMSKGKPFEPKYKKAYQAEAYGNYGSFRNCNKGERYPKQVIEFNVVGVESLHPTQKPVALFEYLIRTYTNEGETVLDNCAGSGTTAIACFNTNRNYILIEKEKEYIDIINKRIAEHEQQLTIGVIQ